MASSFHVQRRVEFSETDAAGIAHFSAFFLYMEQAEHAFLRHAGLSVFLHDPDGTITWPRVNAQCDFVDAVRFEDVLDVEVTIKRLGQKSVTYGFDFAANGRRTATGQMTSVCCRVVPNQPPRSMAIPDWIAEKLRTIAQSTS
jgi:acyl-CoA thioester hydrolase